MQSFESFRLEPGLLHNLAQMSYATPTPVQAKAIPLALQGLDIMGSAQTGTGKTAAFSIPLVQFLLTNSRGSALVLSPTRELAKQIHVIILQLLGAKSPLDSALLIGGESMGKQLKQLRARPRIIVGTPGRVNDHLERGSLLLHDTRYLVLDETDRMLDMGFSVQLDRILHYMPEKRQTLMFSATLPPNIIKLSAKYMHKPERVAVGSTTVPVKAIKQSVFEVSADSKYHELLKHLRDCHGSVVVFVKTKFGADKMAKRLRKDDVSAQAIHGNLNQNKRDRVIRDFRQKKFQVLVATDVAARGLDIPHIEHVINYDLPQVPEDYIHRIGRTARAGAEGEAINLLTPQDRKKWQAIQCLIDPDAKPPRKSSGNKRRGKPGGRSGKPGPNQSPRRRHAKPSGEARQDGEGERRRRRHVKPSGEARQEGNGDARRRRSGKPAGHAKKSSRPGEKRDNARRSKRPVRGKDNRRRSQDRKQQENH